MTYNTDKERKEITQSLIESVRDVTEARARRFSDEPIYIEAIHANGSATVMDSREARTRESYDTLADALDSYPEAVLDYRADIKGKIAPAILRKYKSQIKLDN